MAAIATDFPSRIPQVAVQVIPGLPWSRGAPEPVGAPQATHALTTAFLAGRRQRQADEMLLAALREALAGEAP